MTTIEEMRKDCSWREAFGYAGEPGTCATNFHGGPNVVVVLGDDADPMTFTMADVEEIFAASEGDYDGPDWVCYGKLKDGRYFSLEAGCDYTGWD